MAFLEKLNFMFFDAAVVFVTRRSLLFRLALATQQKRVQLKFHNKRAFNYKKSGA